MSPTCGLTTILRLGGGQSWVLADGWGCGCPGAFTGWAGLSEPKEEVAEKVLTNVKALVQGPQTTGIRSPRGLSTRGLQSPDRAPCPAALVRRPAVRECLFLTRPQVPLPVGPH